MMYFKEKNIKAMLDANLADAHVVRKLASDWLALSRMVKAHQESYEEAVVIIDLLATEKEEQQEALELLGRTLALAVYEEDDHAPGKPGSENDG